MQVPNVRLGTSKALFKNERNSEVSLLVELVDIGRFVTIFESVRTLPMDEANIRPTERLSLIHLGQRKSHRPLTYKFLSVSSVSIPPGFVLHGGS
jgi:hypothetical protein